MPKGFLFDVYGTVCDWFTPMRDGLNQFAAARGATIDAPQLARDWRNGYVRATGQKVRDNSPFVPLQQITAVVLSEVLADAGIGASAAELSELNDVWRELPPWPDVHEGLRALKAIGPIAPCSNGNFADMTALAEVGDLPWTLLAGSEVSGFYKPHADTYLKSAAKLGLAPEETMMVAAHQGDLAAAQSFGLQTAFVIRPSEFGGKGYGEELEVTGDWTVVATSFIDLAEQLKA